VRETVQADQVQGEVVARGLLVLEMRDHVPMTHSGKTLDEFWDDVQELEQAKVEL